jgi:hypothetical protein
MSRSWRDVFTVRPVAAMFPPLDKDELRELGEDIKKNGLREPAEYIEENGTKILVDGRKRLDAMERVDVAIFNTVPPGGSAVFSADDGLHGTELWANRLKPGPGRTFGGPAFGRASGLNGFPPQCSQPMPSLSGSNRWRSGGRTVKLRRPLRSWQ